MADIWYAFIGIGAVAGMALVFALIVRFPLTGAIFAGAFVLTLWEIPNMPPLVVLGGFSIYAEDLLSVIFLLVAATRLGQFRHNIGGWLWAWLALGLLLLVAFAHGVAKQPIGQAMNEFRSFLYPYAAFTWAMTLQWSPATLRRFTVVPAYVFGWALALLAAYHIAVNGLGNANQSVVLADGTTQTGRGLVSGQAMYLWISTIFVARDWYHRRTVARTATLGAFLIVLLLSEQRTVWVLMIVSVAIAGVKLNWRARVVTLVAMGFAVVVGFFTFALNGSSSFVQNIVASVTSTGTYSGREDGWSALLGQSFAKGGYTILLGAPFGSGYGRFEGTSGWVTFAPHNWYLMTYLRVGVVGLTVFMLFFGGALVVGLVRRNVDPVALMILVSTMVYCWTYGLLWYCALAQGWAFVTLMRRPSRDDGAAPQREHGRSVHPIAVGGRL